LISDNASISAIGERIIKANGSLVSGNSTVQSPSNIRTVTLNGLAVQPASTVSGFGIHKVFGTGNLQSQSTVEGIGDIPRRHQRANGDLRPSVVVNGEGKRTVKGNGSLTTTAQVVCITTRKIISTSANLPQNNSRVVSPAERIVKVIGISGMTDSIVAGVGIKSDTLILAGFRGITNAAVAGVGTTTNIDQFIVVRVFEPDNIVTRVYPPKDITVRSRS